MLQESFNMLPVLTSEEGSCLTSANWQEVGVKTVVYYLDSLLLKPGIATLKKIADFKSYIGWYGSLILNASNLCSNKDGLYILKSPYDGSKIKISCAELIEIILNLKPDAVLLPEKVLIEVPDFGVIWDDAIMPFFAHGDVGHIKSLRPHGVYFNLKDLSSLDVITDAVASLGEDPIYVFGDLNWDLVSTLIARGIQFIEYIEPAQLAFQGKVYSKKGVFDLASCSEAMQFDLIDDDCSCLTCSQKLTKAYLHHLFLHTPLLAQRFLIQHNMAFCSFK